MKRYKRTNNPLEGLRFTSALRAFLVNRLEPDDTEQTRARVGAHALKRLPSETCISYVIHPMFRPTRRMYYVGNFFIGHARERPDGLWAFWPADGRHGNGELVTGELAKVEQFILKWAASDLVW